MWWGICSIIWAGLAHQWNLTVSAERYYVWLLFFIWKGLAIFSNLLGAVNLSLNFELMKQMFCSMSLQYEENLETKVDGNQQQKNRPPLLSAEVLLLFESLRVLCWKWLQSTVSIVISHSDQINLILVDTEYRFRIPKSTVHTSSFWGKDYFITFICT